MEHSKHPWRTHSYFLVPILYLITFPDFQPIYEPGIDGSISFVFNYIFHHNLELGSDIIFPHGLLAFLMYPVPLGYNLELAMIYHSVIALVFGLSLFRLAAPRDVISFVFTGLLLWLLFSALSLQLLIIGLMVSAIFITIKENKPRYILFFIPLAAMAIYIKSYVGIVSGLLVFAFIGYQLLVRRNWRSAIAVALTYGISFLILWVLLYQDMGLLPGFLKGITELAGDNSTAVSYYPDNNWWLLGISLLLFLSAPLFLDRGKMLLAYIIILPAFFGTWKHGMARQDIFHTGQLLVFMGLMAILLLCFSARFRWKMFGVLSVSLVCFYFNFTRVMDYQNFRISLWGAPNLSALLNLNDYKSSKLNESIERSARLELSSDQKLQIGNDAVDTYPWDYAMIPANGLNWQPRPVLQSYASYTSWLDLQNKEHLESDDAPRFILWEVDKLSQARYGETLGSVDRRYLLNDEPQFLAALFTHYKVVSRSDKVLIFQKRPEPLDLNPLTVDAGKVKWNEWIEVPENRGQILRAKLEIHPNTKGNLKEFLYKGEETFVYYRLESGLTYSYKIVPKNAEDGIWINPFIPDVEQPGIGKVVAIQLRSSNRDLMKSEIGLSWEYLNYGEEIFKFHIKPLPKGNYLAEDQLVLRDNDTLVQPGDFSKGFSLVIDSLELDSIGDKVRVYASAWFKAPKYGNAVLVISLQDGNRQIIWKQAALSDFVIDPRDVNYALLVTDIPKEMLTENPGAALNVSVWNVNDSPIELHDLGYRVEPDNL